LSASQATQVEEITIGEERYPRYVNEYWTAGQRQTSSIHEISYRACFKPQLPAFFINWLSREGETVYDPFGGRGTTAIEAALLKRRVISNDANPLSRILTEPRLHIPAIDEIARRLEEIETGGDECADIDLSMFYHPKTEAEIVSLRNYLAERRSDGSEDAVDRWIRMVATNRLTGHSRGFFSVYTLPPNQAVSQESQRRINEKRTQAPEYRNTKELILKKSRSLVRNLTPDQIDALNTAGRTAVFLHEDARTTGGIGSGSVRITITSPPFLNIVQYSKDNWLRCWFNALDTERISERITMARTVEAWSGVMKDVFRELYRITADGGYVAFEVGEVNKGKIRLDEHVIPLGLGAGFECPGILANVQEFTKTSNIWGVNNNNAGTNTNRIVLFKKTT
ncbi:MAG TPA: site-specific DNA-methyltransferase, partial [Methanofollis liminatans]|nr:site-specific DNA-methyltransferase [Methanofollis liminatans]